MKRLACLCLVTLAACSQANDAPPPSDAEATPAAIPTSVVASMAGTSWTFEQPGVGTMVSTFAADGRFVSKHEDTIAEQGTWTEKDGKLCEDDDATPDHTLTCYTLATELPPVGSTMTVAGDDGSFEVTRVS